MNGIHINRKRSLTVILTAVLVMTQLTGCIKQETKDMVAMIDAGETLLLEPSSPSTYEIKTMTGETDSSDNWVQLDQLKTYNMGFRQEFDEIFNINTVAEEVQGGIGGKQGSLYVKSVNGQEMRSGNTTINDIFRNKTFITKYWDDKSTQTKLKSLVGKAYSDIDENSGFALIAVLNAYCNLLEDAKNPDSFNPTQSVSRENFYELLYKSSAGVSNIDYDSETDEFALAVGGDTKYTKYAKQVENLNFITTGNKGLDGINISKPISRAEAIYMLVQKYFPEEYAATTGKESAYADTTNAEDLAFKVGFKQEVEKERQNAETGKTEKYKELIIKDKWELYTLGYMFKNSDKGLQSEIYRAMVVAKQAGILKSDNCRWNEVLSRSEAIVLLVNTQLALNDRDGYVSTTEYATIEAPNQNIDINTGETGTGEGNGSNEGTITYTLGDMTETQLSYFKETSEKYLDNLLSGYNTLEGIEILQDEIITTMISTSALPYNGVELFKQWKQQSGFYEQFKDMEESEATSSEATSSEAEESKAGV